MLTAIKHAFRRLASTPGFTATAIATLAICLGANLAIYAVVDAVLVRSLPYPVCGRLVTVYNSYPGAGVDRAGASLSNYFDRRHALKAFSSVSIEQDGSVVVGGTADPQRVADARISPEFFATLGVPLAMGRTFTDAQFPYGADEVAVLTDGYWRSAFNADPQVIGRTFLNDGIKITVVGVLPAHFTFFSSHAEFFRPLSHDVADRGPKNRHNNSCQMIARLAPGVTVAAAQAEMNAFNEQQIKDDPFAQLIKGAGYHTIVSSLHDDYVRQVRPMLVLLQAGVVSLLLIGGVNLVNLLLVRANGRTKEMAVRQALGARRRHVARDVLVETSLLAVAGSLGGVLLGAFGVALLRRLGTDQIPLGATIAFDGRIAVAAVAIMVVVSVLLAVPIVVFHLHSRLALGLQSDTRGGTAGRGAQRLRHIFIVGQVAIAFVLLSGAGLLGVSLRRVLASPTGFSSDHILTGAIALPWKSYKDDASRRAFVRRLLPAIRALPGVSEVAITTGLPFTGGVNDSVVTVEGIKPKPGEGVRAHYISVVSSDYWTLMGIPLRRGRLLNDADDRPDTRVCVVDQAFADRYWPGEDPLGRRVAFDVVVNKDNANTVVGVVGNVKQNDLTDDSAHGAVYRPYSAFNANYFLVAVRTPLPPTALATTIQKAVRQLDPEMPVDDLRPMQGRIDDSLVVRRSPAILAGIFAAVALLLAAIGTYGVLSYAVAQRRREIGLRMALGAQIGQIRNQFLGVGLRLLAAGTVIGVGLAWLAGWAMRTVLYGVPAVYVPTLAITVLVMSAVTLLACVLPARRATRVDPAIALREEY